MGIDIPRLRKVLRDTRHQVFDDKELLGYHKKAQKWAEVWPSIKSDVDLKELVFWFTVSLAASAASLDWVPEKPKLNYQWIYKWAESKICKIIDL